VNPNIYNNPFPNNMALAYLHGSFHDGNLNSLGAYLVPMPRIEKLDSNTTSQNTIPFDDSNLMDWHNAKFPRKITLFVSQGINALQTEYIDDPYPINRKDSFGNELSFELEDQ